MERSYAYEEPEDGALESDMGLMINGQIDHCLAEIALLDGRSGDNIVTVYLERLDPSVRIKFIELIQLELEAFKRLDPLTATEADVHAIANFFTEQRNNITPKRQVE